MEAERGKLLIRGLSSHDWTKDRLHGWGGRLKDLLTEVGLTIGTVTERWGLAQRKLLELLLKRSLRNCSRLGYLGSRHLKGEGVHLNWWWHEALGWLHLPILLGRLLKLQLILHWRLNGEGN